MYLEAISRDSEKSLYFSNLGVLYHRWKKLDQAAAAYQQALRIEPRLQSARTNLDRLIQMKTGE
jgi:Flp pilus assembly protein TadD